VKNLYINEIMMKLQKALKNMLTFSLFMIY